MPVFRLLIVALAVWLAISLMRRLYRRPTRPPALPRYTDVVPCRECGVHLPRSEALRGGEHFYCSQQHRDVHRGQP